MCVCVCVSKRHLCRICSRFDDTHQHKFRNEEAKKTVHLGDKDGDLRSISLEDRVERIQRLKNERQEHEVRLHLHTGKVVGTSLHTAWPFTILLAFKVA